MSIGHEIVHLFICFRKVRRRQPQSAVRQIDMLKSFLPAPSHKSRLASALVSNLNEIEKFSRPPLQRREVCEEENRGGKEAAAGAESALAEGKAPTNCCTKKYEGGRTREKGRAEAHFVPTQKIPSVSAALFCDARFRGVKYYRFDVSGMTARGERKTNINK